MQSLTYKHKCTDINHISKEISKMENNFNIVIEFDEREKGNFLVTCLLNISM